MLTDNSTSLLNINKINPSVPMFHPPQHKKKKKNPQTSSPFFTLTSIQTRHSTTNVTAFVNQLYSHTCTTIKCKYTCTITRAAALHAKCDLLFLFWLQSCFCIFATFLQFLFPPFSIHCIQSHGSLSILNLIFFFKKKKKITDNRYWKHTDDKNKRSRESIFNKGWGLSK